MKQKFPDYENCIANLPNSILAEFGVKEEGRQGLKALTPYLEKGYENIVVLLLDGMGKCILEKNLSPNGFFNTHLKTTYSSVFPPTTVAATTSVANGLNPCEHGWLGWDCYYPEIDKNVTVFLNTETGTDQQAADYNVAWKYCGYESVVSKIRAKGGNAYEVTPFAEPFPNDFQKICEQIRTLCKKPGKKYIYSYWNEPDHIMHEKGCYGTEAVQTVRKLEQQVQQLCEELDNTLVIVTADHGHMDSKGVSITDYPGIMECLVRMPSIEPRALNLFVREEKREQFEHEFKKEFGEKFLLWTKEQTLQSKLFGTGTAHPQFEKMLGDYLAIAIDDLSIYSTKEEADFFIGVHAGLTEDEMTIPLIIIEEKGGMKESVDLTLATEKDAELLHKLQTEAFMPLYEKYHDNETSPVKETLERIKEKIAEQTSEFYIIFFEGEPVGGIRICSCKDKVIYNDIRRISPVFIIPEYQNRGIAQRVIQKVFDLYPETITWRLDTIKQEKGNCHLYEKCGFVRTGEEHAVNEQMTLIHYEKTG